MKKRDLLLVILAPLPVLLIPLVGIMVSEEWQWTWHDFVVAWGLLAGTVFAYKLLATRKAANFAYRAAAGLAVAASFFLIWINLAVQIIGYANPANALYFGVILIGLTIAGLTRLGTRGMSWATFAMAFATLLVPVIALLVWPTDFSPGIPGVFMLNSCFVLMFAGSALLFRHAARQEPACR